MTLNALPPEIYRPKLEEAAFSLTRQEGGRAYTLFLHRVRLRATNESVCRSVAAIGLAEDGQFDLFLHWPTVKDLPPEAFRELLKHEILHPVHGHVGERWKSLCAQYGKDIANYAADIVVNQHVNTDALAKAGLKGLTLQFFVALDPRFRPNLATSDYASFFVNPTPGVAQWLAGRPKETEFTVEVIEGKISGLNEVFGQILDSITGERAQAQILRIIEQVEAELKISGGEFSRGWKSCDTGEMIEQSKRVSPTPWDEKLRNIESQCRSEERVATNKRPSRRHPAYFGRIRHSKLRVWFGMDTSGSMRPEQLEVIQPELEAILDRGECELTLLHIDAELKQMKKFERGDKLVEFFGRGGTDFSPFLLALENVEPDEHPHMMIYYTDGYGTIEAYATEQIAWRGQAWWDKFTEHYRPHSPEGVTTLWLLAEGTTKPEDFREIVTFGEIAVLPSLKCQENEEN